MTIIPCQQWLSVMPVPYVLSFLFPGVQITFYFIDYNQIMSHHKRQSCLIHINGTYLNIHLGIFYYYYCYEKLHFRTLLVDGELPISLGWMTYSEITSTVCGYISMQADVYQAWHVNLTIWMFSSGFPNISKPWSYVGQSGKGPEKKLNFRSILYRESLRELDYSAWRREGSGENGGSKKMETDSS